MTDQPRGNETGTPNASHAISLPAKTALGISLAAVLGIRFAEVIQALCLGDESHLLAFPLTVIFPAIIMLTLGSMAPASSREGAFMRIGTMVQCLAIVAFPKWALHLALGLPVVFLVVELFETRCPVLLRQAVTRRLVA